MLPPGELRPPGQRQPPVLSTLQSCRSHLRRSPRTRPGRRMPCAPVRSGLLLPSPGMTVLRTWPALRPACHLQAICLTAQGALGCRPRVVLYGESSRSGGLEEWAGARQLRRGRGRSSGPHLRPTGPLHVLSLYRPHPIGSRVMVTASGALPRRGSTCVIFESPLPDPVCLPV